MTMTEPFDPAAMRRSIYWMLAIATISLTTARIVSVERTYEPSLYKNPAVRTWPKESPVATPMFSSNDRSRWATVRAIVDEGTFAIGRRIEDPASTKGYRDEGIIFENDYASVDRIKDPKTGLFYSTKPTLFTVVVAGEYRLLKQVFGWSIVEDKWPVVCTILFTVNVLPLIVFLVMIGTIIERTMASDWTKLLAFTTACFGTFLTTFAVTLNNHLPAAVCVLAAAFPLLASKESAPLPRIAFVVGGLFAGLAVTLELPAASFLAGAGLLYFPRDKRLTLALFVPAAIVPLLALAATNYAALGEVTPAYAKFGSEWYEYPGSHWANKSKGGIDFADEPKSIYAFHVLFGHHGVFSLTPLFVLSFLGMLQLSRQWVRERTNRSWFGAVVLGISAVVVAFYITRTNNYGGWTGGPRWFFWLTPLWIVLMLPILDRLASSRSGRGIGYGLLALSIFSASYPLWNPWRHPWIYQLCEYLGWVAY